MQLTHPVNVNSKSMDHALMWRCFKIGALITILAAFYCMALIDPVYAKKRDVSDVEISMAVESEFWGDSAVDPNRIDVKTQKGVVTLDGAVRHLLAKERAERIAETVVGVRAVVNRIQVEPVVIPSDAELAKAVKQALLLDPAAESYEITPVSKAGVVTLNGVVDSWQERRLCETVAKSVPGVAAVKNNITVKYKTERSDTEIKKDIEARLKNDVRVDDHLIQVEVKDGQVTLAGSVGSVSEKNRATWDAYVGAVNSVDSSGLKIEWWARDKMRRKSAYQKRSDEEIKKAVQDAFIYDPRVYSFNPVVYVNNGNVTLNGIVDNLKAKKAAEQDARNVIGVWRVKNHLKVRPTDIPSNETLEKRVSQALLTNPWVDRFDIDIDAVAGWIHLSGEVTNFFEKDMAERVSDGVNGVVHVVNNITYSDSWNWKPDLDILENVNDELFWSPFVDEEQVNIEVSNGVVTLTGEVDTWSERRAAKDNAYEGGAREVINNLTVVHKYYGPYYYYRPYY